jgi:hypothetical protein
MNPKINPFNVYFYATIIVFFIYLLNFSDLYPELGSVIIIFFSLTSLISILISKSIINNVKIKEIKNYDINKKHDVIISIIIIILFIFEFIHFGTVPLFGSLGSTASDYSLFGVKTLHPILIGVSTFYGVYWWSIFIKLKYKLYFYMAMVPALASLLMLSRGGFLFIFICYVIIYANYNKFRIYFYKIVIVLIVVGLSFGFLGELRTINNDNNIEKAILNYGEANSNFYTSGLPDSFFWLYIYITSPLANFQSIIDNIGKVSNLFDPLVGIIIDFSPDFLSKNFIHSEIKEIFEGYTSIRIHPAFTVSTAFARPLITLGWIGPWLLYLYINIFFLTIIFLTRNSKYSIGFLSICCAMSVLNFFDNMIIFSGAINPIIVGLILFFFERFRLR